MLEVLRIKNIAIIDEAEIFFKTGLNILSGETGAGKSIIIEAISLLLGSRASAELIRSGCDEAVIEGLFQISNIPWIASRLEQFGFASQTRELLIKRTVHRAGRHRITINGELATLSTLENICEGLIDLCSQHEHQSLLKPSTQIELLDRYGGLTEQAKQVSVLFKQTQSLRQEQEDLQREDLERERKKSFLKFQIDEIREAQLLSKEDQLLHEEKQLLQSAEARVQVAHHALQILESEETGTATQLRIALQKLRSLQLLDPRVQSMAEALEQAVLETEEVTLSLRRYVSSIELNPERLQSLQDRLSLLSDLKRKYGNTFQDIFSHLEKIEKEFFDLNLIDEKTKTIKIKLHQSEEELLTIGKKLSQARENVKKLLENSVTTELKDLKMDEAKFLIELSSKDSLLKWTPSGADTIQFMVQTNRGEPPRPLGKVASGGELSRLMLAIRHVISDRGGIGVYLFDEIDTGMGGQTAFQVGKKLKSVASYNQVICITHLPQVASFADHHLVVRKSSEGTRTKTEITSLSHPEKKEELARMLGGPKLTQKSLENASELLELAKNSELKPPHSRKSLHENLIL